MAAHPDPQLPPGVIVDLIAAVGAVKAAFGAPGDHGYDTPEGAALFALYRASVNLANHFRRPDAEGPQ